tara:strand:+ start:231 stop:995 length:765 start_codon:yes stop_codon:yes gene_type:complete
MKLKLCIITCILAAAGTLYFISIDDYYISAVARIVFKLLLLAVFLSSKKVQNKTIFYSFFGLLLLSDVISMFFEVSSLVIVAIGVVFFAGYLLLLKDSFRQYKIRDVRNVVAIYYFFVIAINAVLMVFHLYNLYNYMEESPLIYMGQVFYNSVLYLMVINALAYYLNSYSKKSMFFLIGALAFVCSDILVSAYYFYNIKEDLILIHTVLSMIGYLFFFNYFFTAEKPQMIEEEILEELRERKIKAKNDVEPKLP